MTTIYDTTYDQIALSAQRARTPSRASIYSDIDLQAHAIRAGAQAARAILRSPSRSEEAKRAAQDWLARHGAEED